MLKVLILHGWQGSEFPHWQGWLAQELVLENCIVAFPQLSDNHSPQKEVWVGEALNVIESFRPDVVVCHSLGNILWYHICKHLSMSIQKLLLCAPPRDLSEYEEVASFFPVDLPSDLHAEQVLMVASDNDPYMSIDQSIMSAMRMQIDLKIVKEGGHLNADSGYGPWPWVKEWVLS